MVYWGESKNKKVPTDQDWLYSYVDEDDANTIIKMYKDGETISTISHMLEFDPQKISEIIHKKKIHRGRGKMKGTKCKQITDEIDLQISKMYKDGVKVQRICELFGINKSTVYNSLRRHNIRRRKEIKQEEQRLEIRYQKWLNGSI